MEPMDHWNRSAISVRRTPRRAQLPVSPRRWYNRSSDLPMKSLTPLLDVDSLDAAIAESRERPVLLFKHSRHCGTSFVALDELHAHIEGTQPDSAAYKMITVQTHRPVSDAVSQRFGIRHETPQA